LTQSIYDDEAFFEAYSRLPRSVQGLEGAPEWPALRAHLPALEGRRVLDLGCGFGWFCRWAREHGAAAVLGLDVSERMLARARAESHDPAIAYVRADLERLDVAAGSFDLVHSALAFHYVEDLAGLLAGRRLSRRGAALHRLARAGRDQAAPHDRDLRQPADRRGARPLAPRRVGTERGPGRRAPGVGERAAAPAVPPGGVPPVKAA
jgi:SAM-dependent methyltransferase